MYRLLFWLATFAFAFNAYRPWIANISLADALYFLSLITLLITALTDRRTKIRFGLAHPFWIPSLLILLGGLIASLHSEFPLISARVSATQFYIFTLWLALGIWMSQAGEMERIIVALIAGSTVASFFAIVDFVFGLRTGWWFVTTPNLLDRTFWYRSGGTLGNPNELALYNAVVIPLMVDRILHWFSQAKKSLLSWRMFLQGLCFLIIFLGLIFSGSATGIIGALISSSIVFASYLLAKSSRRNIHLLAARGLFIPLILSAFGFVVFLFFPNYVDATITNLAYQNMLLRVTNLSLTARAILLQKGFELLAENPFWGYGMDQTGTAGLSLGTAQYLTDLYIHNTIIQMWFGGGVLALTGAVLLYWHCLRHAWNAIVDFMRGVAPPYILGLAASTVSWILMDQVQANIYQRFKWLVIALLIGQLNRSRCRNT